MHEEPTRRLLLPVLEAAAVLGVQRTTIYRLLDDGSLERVKIGRRTLITCESVDAYVQRLRAAAHVVA